MTVVPLLTLLTGLALAGSTQELVYDLRYDGNQVGTREITIEYLPAEEGVTGTSRLIKSWLDFTVPVAGQAVHVKSRAGARVTPNGSSFVVSIEERGHLREVQAVSGGGLPWTVLVIENKERKEWEYRRSQVHLTSMDLLDPERHKLIFDRPTASVLVAETGQIVTGPVQSLGEDTLKVGGREVLVRKVLWNPEGGSLEATWTTDGVLVDYQVGFMGKTLRATLRELPAAPTYGAFEVGPMSPGGSLAEEEL